jgi:bacteriocin biosynthesis cyclodehydratase domain-containing protein
VDGARHAHAADGSLSGVPRPARPALKPGLRLLRRDGTAIQLGVTPGAALVLDGVDELDRRVLDLLDGSRDPAGVVRDAAALGIDPVRATELLDMLRRAGALDDGPPAVRAATDRLAPDALALSLRHRRPGAAARALARRAETLVTVHGGGRVGGTVAGLLSAAGIGRVDVADAGPVRPVDLAPGGIRRIRTGSRGEAATRAAAASAKTTQPPPALRRIDVVAPVGFAAAPELLAAVRRRTHLFVAVRDVTAVVGPLVVPGHTPCLRCLELGRGERDPAWPRLAAQLVGEPAAVEPCDIVLATSAAALAAAQLLALVDGVERPATMGGVLELGAADGRVRRRSVSSHPACGCSPAPELDTMEA